MRRCFRLLHHSALPWESTLKQKIPTLHDRGSPYYKALGTAILNESKVCDAGEGTYAECLIARRQLEQILRSMGYELDVLFFGGLVSLGFFEVSGDLDFVGLGDVEPRHEEAAAIAQRVSKEMRRLGLRSMAIPRAKVPVVRCDRTSVWLPGTPVTPESATVSFPFARPLSSEERDSFWSRLESRYGVRLRQTWRADHQCVAVQFHNTEDAVHAMTSIRRHGDVEIPVRAPLDARNAPELYRYPFDLCFGSMGLQNTFLMRRALMAYPGARHLLLALKKWGKGCRTINSLDGYLASYAYTSMLAHFLVQCDRIAPLNPEELMTEPQLLPKDPEYVSLRADSPDPTDVGYLFVHFICYFAHSFDYDNSVVCCTTKDMSKSSLHWTTELEGENGKPPYYSFAMKDPYGSENIARVVDATRLKFIRDSFSLAAHVLCSEANDPEFALKHLLEDAPRPSIKQNLETSMETEDARRLLFKKQFQHQRHRKDTYGEHAMQEQKQQTAASSIAQSVVGWLGTRKKQSQN